MLVLRGEKKCIGLFSLSKNKLCYWQQNNWLHARKMLFIMICNYAVLCPCSWKNRWKINIAPSGRTILISKLMSVFPTLSNSMENSTRYIDRRTVFSVKTLSGNSNSELTFCKTEMSRVVNTVLYRSLFSHKSISVCSIIISFQQ